MSAINDYRALFRDMIARLASSMRLDAAILFGSRATGKAHDDSDYDLVFIGDFKDDTVTRMKTVLRLKPRVPVDVFCFTPDEFSRAFHSFDLVAIDAIGEGLVLLGDGFVHAYKQLYKDLSKAGMKKKRSVLVLPSP